MQCDKLNHDMFAAPEATWLEVMIPSAQPRWVTAMRFEHWMHGTIFTATDDVSYTIDQCLYWRKAVDSPV